MDFKCAVLSLLAIFALFKITNGFVEYTNIICEATDRSFADFEYCYLKAVNRTYKYFSLRVNLFKVPVSNISVGFAVKKKANGYKPFLYNASFEDACKFMKNRNTYNVLFKYAYSFISSHTNMNHSCPYDHDIIVEKQDASFMNNQVTRILSWPEGEYGIFTTWSAYKKKRANVNVFFKISY